MNYKEYGNLKAPLLIFIHGGGVSGWMWDKQVCYFSDFHVVVPELHSPENDSSFLIAQSADRLISLIEEKRQNKPVIAVGFSYGAQVLLATLGKEPELVDYAMLNSALVKPVPFQDVLVKAAVFFQPLIKNRRFSKMQARSMYIEDPYLDAYYRDSSHLNKKELACMLRENMSFTLPDNFGSVSADILVTAGEKERSVMKESLVKIVKSNSNCRGILFPEIGHGIPFTNPDLFNLVIDRWLCDLPFPEQVIHLSD